MKYPKFAKIAVTKRHENYLMILSSSGSINTRFFIVFGGAVWAADDFEFEQEKKL